MAIADDDLHELIRQRDPVDDERPPGYADERRGSVVPAGTPAARMAHRSRWAATAGVAAVATVAIAGAAVWPSGGEPSAAAVVRNAVGALDHIESYEAFGEEDEPGVRDETWSILVDGHDAAFASRVVVSGRIDESAVTYVGDAVYLTARGQTELRPRVPAEGFATRYHELLTALTAALDGADVTEAHTTVVDGVSMTRYYVGLTEESIASLSAAGGAEDLIADPDELEELRVCVADGHHVHEVHFVYRDGRTIDVTLANVNGDIEVTPPDGPFVG